MDIRNPDSPLPGHPRRCFVVQIRGLLLFVNALPMKLHEADTEIAKSRQICNDLSTPLGLAGRFTAFSETIGSGRYSNMKAGRAIAV